MSCASTKNIWKCAIQKVTLCFLMALMKVRWGSSQGGLDEVFLLMVVVVA
jgi:hypothetical protein